MTIGLLHGRGREFGGRIRGNSIIPLALQRVGSQANKEGVGAEQVKSLLEDEHLPFGEAFCVEVEDSAYSKPAFLHVNRAKPNLVTITHARGTRTCYQAPLAETDEGRGKGHPTWYGAPFCLKEAATWGHPRKWRKQLSSVSASSRIGLKSRPGTTS